MAVTDDPRARTGTRVNCKRIIIIVIHAFNYFSMYIAALPMYLATAAKVY